MKSLILGVLMVSLSSFLFACTDKCDVKEFCSSPPLLVFNVQNADTGVQLPEAEIVVNGISGLFDNPENECYTPYEPDCTHVLHMYPLSLNTDHMEIVVSAPELMAQQFTVDIDKDECGKRISQQITVKLSKEQPSSSNTQSVVFSILEGC